MSATVDDMLYQAKARQVRAAFQTFNANVRKDQLMVLHLRQADPIGIGRKFKYRTRQKDARDTHMRVTDDGKVLKIDWVNGKPKSTWLCPLSELIGFTHLIEPPGTRMEVITVPNFATVALE